VAVVGLRLSAVAVSLMRRTRISFVFMSDGWRRIGRLDVLTFPWGWDGRRGLGMWRSAWSERRASPLPDWGDHRSMGILNCWRGVSWETESMGDAGVCIWF
jgi:hypothetical protein